MQTTIKEITFKKDLPIGFEIKDLSYVKEHPNFFKGTRKATFYQMIWITGGKACFYIDFREIAVQSGEVLIISTNQVYEFDILSDYTGKLILFTDAFFNQNELDVWFLSTSEILNPIQLNRTVSVDPVFMREMVSLLGTELQKPVDLFRERIVQNYLNIILLTFERIVTSSRSPSFLQPHATLARQFFDAVKKHFKENRNTDYYVQLLGVSEKLLSKEIKLFVGKTPKVYIDSRIILEAKRLLTYGFQTVKEISWELGFDEATNFNKYFRKHTGTTPLLFRRSAQKQ